MHFKEFFTMLASYLMLVIIVIALIGAIVSDDVFFNVTGVLALIIVAAITVRTFNAHDPKNPSNHPNHL